MRLLLDTHILIWAITLVEKLPETLRVKIEDRENTILFSTVSIWEIAIKAAMAKPDFRWDPADILNEAERVGLEETFITSRSAMTAAALPPYHKDPFDRLLVAQAMSEPARLVTADRILQRYSELVDVI